jgi:hypothetical protein
MIAAARCRFGITGIAQGAENPPNGSLRACRDEAYAEKWGVDVALQQTRVPAMDQAHVYRITRCGSGRLDRYDGG